MKPGTLWTGAVGSELPRLGPRGEGWVALQTVLIAALVGTGVKGRRWPRSTSLPRVLAALPAGALGIYLLTGGIGGLGRHLTPFPRPVEQAELRSDGAYGLVRHPIYGGVLLLALAWGLLTSPAVLPAWVVSALFLDLKRRREEAWLEERHADYGEYREDVPRSLLPYVW
jgi:protein-S-isoprenylcysteine O-methyltransferase Ste14